MKYRLLSLSVSLLCLFLTGCISVPMSNEVRRSKGVSFQTPEAPFKSLDSEFADKVWKSAKTGNTISYFSECGPTQASLQQIRNESLLSFPQVAILSEQEITFDERPALNSSLKSKIEGFDVYTDLLVYQKNGCRYFINYSGIEASFQQERPVAEKFKSRFKAP